MVLKAQVMNKTPLLPRLYNRNLISLYKITFYGKNLRYIIEIYFLWKLKKKKSKLRKKH